MRSFSLLVALLLLPFLSAQLAPQMTFSDAQLQESLNVQIEGQTNPSFAQSPQIVQLTFTVQNPYAEALDVYVAAWDRQNGAWVVIEQIGTVPANSQSVIPYNASFQYGGQRQELTRLAVVAERNGLLIGHVFTVQEEWSAYEDTVKGSWWGIALIGVPIGLLATAGVILFALLIAFLRKGSKKEEGEYTLKTLFLPHVSGRPISELIADLMINPFFWAVEALAGIFLIGLILIFALAGNPLEIGLLVFLTAGAVCWLLPLVYLILAWILDWWGREPFRFPFSLFMWGLAAAFLSFFANTFIDLILQIFFGIALGQTGVILVTILGAVMVAPIVEELAKGFGVLIVSGHHEMHDTYDGLFYGFAAGLGFAAIENWFYFAGKFGVNELGLLGWISLVGYRSLLNSLGHGFFTAFTGGAIGFLKARGFKGWSVLGFVPGVLIAMGLHATFNFFAIVDGILMFITQMPIFLFDPLLMAVLTGLFVFVLLPISLLEARGKWKERMANEAKG